MKPHKWAKEIKAWADGADIEYKKIGTDKWYHEKEDFPYWDSIAFEYRIKPQPKEPQYLYVYGNGVVTITSLEKANDCNGIPYIGKIKLEEEN